MMARAPEMLHAKIMNGGSAAFERLNDRFALAQANVGSGKVSAIGNRRIIGDGNVDRWSATRLDMVSGLCANLREGSSEIHDAVYVVGTLEPTCVKVGVAADPIARLAQLQTGNPDRLYLHRVFWTYAEGDAQNLERISHLFLGRKTTRLVGEWFACSPMTAHETIINACRSSCMGFLAVTPNDGKEIKLERII